MAAPNEETEPNQETHTMPVDDYIDFNLSPQRFICRKHVKELNRLPKDFKQFFYKNQKKFYPGKILIKIVKFYSLYYVVCY